jgi:hypothetical protein
MRDRVVAHIRSHHANDEQPAGARDPGARPFYPPPAGVSTTFFHTRTGPASPGDHHIRSLDKENATTNDAMKERRIGSNRTVQFRTSTIRPSSMKPGLRMARHIYCGIGESIDDEQQNQGNEKCSPRMLKTRSHEHEKHGPAEIGDYQPILLERCQIAEKDATQTQREV